MEIVRYLAFKVRSRDLAGEVGAVASNNLSGAIQAKVNKSFNFVGRAL